MYFPGALSKVVQSVDTIDVPALRERVLYDFPYHPTHRVARMFWHLVEKELSVEDVRKLLLFWTGSSIVPREDVEENKVTTRICASHRYNVILYLAVLLIIIVIFAPYNSCT